MRIVTAEVDTRYANLVEVPAGLSVMLPDYFAQYLVRALKREGAPPPRQSTIGHYVRPYCGQDLAGKSLFTWRGHGLGDSFIWAGMLKIIKRLHPDARITMMSHPGLVHIWDNIPDLPFDVYPDPCSFQDFCRYDYHLLGEGLCEGDLEPGQPCTWDGHLRRAGISPMLVVADWKRPLVPVNDRDATKVAEWLDARGIGDRPLIVWQLGASTPIRSSEPGWTRRTLVKLSDEIPDAAIVTIGGRRTFVDYEPVPDRPNIHSAEKVVLRTIFALIKRADLVICPDSMAGHVAAAFERPCVSLWSSFNPADRIKYYSSHRPLYNPLPCSPCRIHETNPNHVGCPRASETGSPYCEGLAGIRPEDVVNTAKEILK